MLTFQLTQLRLQVALILQAPRPKQVVRHLSVYENKHPCTNKTNCSN